MATITLPNKLWRPLNEVKNFVEKMSKGVKLPQMSQKVKSFANLSRKDKDVLIKYLNERDCINVIQARPTSGGNLTTFFFHQKYPLPSSIPGYDWDGTKHKIMMPVEETPSEPAEEPDLQETHDEPLPVAQLHDEEEEDDEDDEDDEETKSSPMVDQNSQSADELRKRALEMLMEAEDAERSRVNRMLNDDVKPRINEFISRLNAANDNVQSTLDILYDHMAEVDKISMEFKKFCSSL